MNEPVYKETQHFTQVWLWVAVMASTIPTLIIIAAVLVLKRSQGIHAPEILVLIVVSLILAFSLLLIRILRLDTEISVSGIAFRFFPFHRKHRNIDWSEISRAYVRKYKPIGEYGGWGIRGLSARNRAYNVRGDLGLQLELKNGNKLLLGTQRPAEIEHLLKELGHND
jgi:hypothetical protein